MTRAWLLAPLVLLAGCGTVGSFVLAGSGAPTPPGFRRTWPLGPVYCGVALDVRLLRRGTPAGAFLAGLDLPLSLALDTLLLPATAPLGVAAWLDSLPEHEPPRVRDVDRGREPPPAAVAPVGTG